MVNKFIFPKIDDFSFTVSHKESLADTDEKAILLIAQEKTEIILSGRVFALSQGDVLLALPYSYLRTKNGSPFLGYQISFPLDVLRTFAPKLNLMSADGGMALSFSGDTVLRLLSVCASLESENALYHLPLLFSIIEKEALPEEERVAEVHLPKLLRRALYYMEKEAPREIGTAELASRYAVSESTLLRAFRAYLATTPRKYTQALHLLYNEKNGVK